MQPPPPRTGRDRLAILGASMLALLALSAQGCREASSVDELRHADDHDHSHGDHDHDHSHGDHDHDHGHGHGHHHGHDHGDPRPAPADFPAAVARLAEGHRAIAEARAGGDPVGRIGMLLPAQLDLAERAPDLAARSDMPEAPWDRVHAAVGRLRSVYQGMIDAREGGKDIDDEEAIAEAGRAVGVLEGVLDEADPDWFPERADRGSGADDEGDGEPAHGEDRP